jgi:serine/threonine protein kinase
MVGTQLLHYKITRKLGAGGMGEVFEAEDLKLGRTVALKFVLEQVAQDEQAIGRFEREAKAVSRMDHPNVGAVFALEQDAGKTFLAMARYQGETLRERLDQARLNLNDALRFSLEIARGLEHAHAQGVTHRDVKPANIFLSRQMNGSGLNNPGVVKLLDFGLARLEDASRMMTKPGATTGTLMYMAPEQMRGQMVAHQVDVWAWGAVTFEMLAGRPPFVQENIGALLAAILSLEPDPLETFCPEAPAKLIELVKHALRKNPAERIESASVIVRELEAIISGVPASSAPAAQIEAPNLKPDLLKNTSSASDHPAFVSGSNWSNPNWPESEPVTRVEPTIKPAGSKSVLWLLAPVALVGIVAGGFGIVNSRLSQPTVQPSVQPESSSKPVTTSSSPAATSSATVKSKPASQPAQTKPNPVKPIVAPAKTVAAVPVAAEVKTPTLTAPVNASAAPSTVVPAKPSARVQPQPPIKAPQQTATVATPAKATVSKPAVPTTASDSKTISSVKPTAPTEPVNATPKPPRAPECKPLVQANAVLERVLIASGNTLPLMDCGSYLHAKGQGNPGWFPEALEVRREVIALATGTVMIADAVHYADARKPLGLMPMPADAKPVANADLSGGHQWRSESENITVNAMNLVFMETRAIQTEAKGEQLEVTSTDDPGTDFVFLTVYQGGNEPISNLNVSTNDAHERSFAGVLLNDETAVFLGPGAQANATNFDVAVPPGIKTYLVGGLEPGTSCKIGFEPDRNWWYISIKPGTDGTVNSAGVVVLETKAPTN